MIIIVLPSIYYSIYYFSFDSLKLILGPLQKSFTKELLADKEGVCVTEVVDFGTVTMGTKRSLVIEVRNNGEGPQKYMRCHLTALNSQISIKHVIYAKV